MSETIKGDVLTKEEMRFRNIRIIPGSRGGVEFRTPQPVSIIEQLLQEGFIEYYHYYDALLLMDLRRAYEAIMGVKWIRLDSPHDSGLSPGEASKLYDAIRHEIGVKRAASIMAMIVHSFEPSYYLRAELKNAYRAAFEELTHAMEAVDKKKEKMLAYV